MPKPTSSSLRWNRAVVRFYNQRGTAEQWIKDGKAATHWTRLLPLAAHPPCPILHRAAESHLTSTLFRQILGRIERLAT